MLIQFSKYVFDSQCTQEGGVSQSQSWTRECLQDLLYNQSEADYEIAAHNKFVKDIIIATVMNERMTGE